MTKYIDMKEVVKKIDLPDGLCLVLLDRLAKESIYGQIECARNIFLVDTAAKIVWQVQTDIDELALVTFNVRESNVSTPYRYYIKNKKSIRIGIIEWGFIIGFEYAIYYNYGYK